MRLMSKKAKKVNLFDPTQVLDFYQKSRQLKSTLAIEEELRQKIIQFTKNLEIDKSKDYDKLRKKFHLSYQFSKNVKDNDEEVPSEKRPLRKYLS